MDWQTFLQWLFIVSAGGSIFGAFLAWAARKNGKETRELINKIDERAEERHREIIELLKRGFSEVITEIRK